MAGNTETIPPLLGKGLPVTVLHPPIPHGGPEVAFEETRPDWGHVSQVTRTRFRGTLSDFSLPILSQCLYVRSFALRIP
jgi:hypothetical protein